MRIQSFLFGLLALVLTVGLAGCDSGGDDGGDSGPPPTVEFAESDATVGEGDGTYTIDVTVTDPGDQVVEASVSFNDSESSATRGDDFAIPQNTTIEFPEDASSGDTQSLDVDIIDDDEFEEIDETAIFDLSAESPSDAEVGGTSTSTLTITDNDQAPPSYEVVADSMDLAPSSGNTDAHCIVQRSTGDVVFFNSSDGGIFSYDSGLNEERSSGDLNSDISAESNTIDRCDGVAKDADDNVYFLLRSDESSSTNSWPTYVYKLPASGSPSVLASEDGLQNVTHNSGTVYLTGVSFRGAPGDGFYSINDMDEGQSVSEVVTESNLDLDYGMDVDSDGNLYAFSGGFADGNRVRKIVRVTDPSGSATLEEFVDPYRDGSPLVSDSGDDIIDVDVVTQDGNEFVVVYNNSFQADNLQWASIQVSDQSISLLFTDTDLVDNLSVEGYTSGFTEPMAVGGDGEVLVASRAAFGGEYYIAKASNVLP